MRTATRWAAIAVGSAVLLAALLALGCAPKATPASVDTRALVGLWTDAEARGIAGRLDEIQFREDGSFRHSGNNALGKPVNFGGHYQASRSAEGPFLRLIYDDFPEQTTVWFYRLDGDKLTVAPRAAELGSANSITWMRAQQQ
jgi:hypothetical protein